MLGVPVPTGPMETTGRLEELTAQLAAARNELSLQRRETVLLQHQMNASALLSSLLPTPPTPVITTSTTGRITTINPTLAAVLGMSPGQQTRSRIQAFMTDGSCDDLHHLMASAASAGAASALVLLTAKDTAPLAADVVVVSAESASGGEVLHWNLTLRELEPAPSRDIDDDLVPLRAVASLSALPVEDLTQHEVLVEIATLASRAVPGADCASLALGDPGHPSEAAVDAVRAQAADGAQWRAAEGPTLSAFDTAAAVLTSDLTADPRWPRLGDRTRGGPVRGALGVPLRHGSEVRGVLTVYSDEVGGLTDGVDVELSQVFADTAAAVLAGHRRTQDLREALDNLRLALTSRAAIEQAKGVVAARQGCGVDDAFAALRVVSQDRNVRVRDIAALLVSEPGNQELDLLLGNALRRVKDRLTR